jgi:hypothetical protein
MLTLYQIEALKIITSKLATTDIRWAVYASGALALQGVDIIPDDLDIITDAKGASVMHGLLGEYEAKSFKKTPSDKFKSDPFILFLIKGVRVEVAGDFCIKTGDRWILMSYLLDTATTICLGDMKIPTPTLHEMVMVYQMMGREKDLAKIKKIENILHHAR